MGPAEGHAMEVELESRKTSPGFGGRASVRSGRQARSFPSLGLRRLLCPLRHFGEISLVPAGVKGQAGVGVSEPRLQRFGRKGVESGASW